jgi:hypothetical protein
MIVYDVYILIVSFFFFQIDPTAWKKNPNIINRKRRVPSVRLCAPGSELRPEDRAPRNSHIIIIIRGAQSRREHAKHAYNWWASDRYNTLQRDRLRPKIFAFDTSYLRNNIPVVTIFWRTTKIVILFKSFVAVAHIIAIAHCYVITKYLTTPRSYIHCYRYASHSSAHNVTLSDQQ